MLDLYNDSRLPVTGLIKAVDAQRPPGSTGRAVPKIVSNGRGGPSAEAQGRVCLGAISSHVGASRPRDACAIPVGGVPVECLGPGVELHPIKFEAPPPAPPPGIRAGIRPYSDASIPPQRRAARTGGRPWPGPGGGGP